MKKTVVINCFPESARLYRHGYAVVAIDVIRATTTAVTVVARGGRCFPVPSLEAARAQAGKLKNPLLAGEIHGIQPDGFDLNNSAAEITLRKDLSRPVVLLSSSGTKLIHEAADCEAVYLACFRNYSAVAAHLAGRYARIALLGAGSLGRFREEDQMCCAWIASRLLRVGFQPENELTAAVARRWDGAPAVECLISESAEYLKRTGQVQDLNFVLDHVDDLDAVIKMEGGEAILLRKERFGGEPNGLAAVDPAPSGAA
ncbi:MAG: 2-phosphosulfolactate phosphatase [Planctomycetes bacterium]|nr:2-phosphosulfolactate phosphatase [Planctomycetota bacterium]